MRFQLFHDHMPLQTVVGSKSKNMKKTLYIIAAALCLLSSCDKPKTVAEKLVGVWHCSSVAIDAEIYADFAADKTFSLLQQIGEGAYREYNGFYELTESERGYILSGEYNDGTPWGSDYELVMAEDKVMTLTAAGITETYNKLPGGVPAEVLASKVTVVKSEGSTEIPFL